MTDGRVKRERGREREIARSKLERQKEGGEGGREERGSGMIQVLLAARSLRELLTVFSLMLLYA